MQRIWCTVFILVALCAIATIADSKTDEKKGGARRFTDAADGADADAWFGWQKRGGRRFHSDDDGADDFVSPGMFAAWKKRGGARAFVTDDNDIWKRGGARRFHTANDDGLWSGFYKRSAPADDDVIAEADEETSGLRAKRPRAFVSDPSAFDSWYPTYYRRSYGDAWRAKRPGGRRFYSYGYGGGRAVPYGLYGTYKKRAA